MIQIVLIAGGMRIAKPMCLTYCLYDIGALQLMSVLEVGKDNNGRTVIN